MKDSYDFIGMRYTENGELKTVVGRDKKNKNLYIVTDKNGIKLKDSMDILVGSSNLKYDYAYVQELEYIFGIL